MSTFREILQYPLFTIGGTTINVFTLSIGVLVAVVSFWIARAAEKATVRFMKRRGLREEGSVGATARLVHYALLVLGLAIALHMVGINLTALFAAGAFFAIALGFAMQTITQNFVSGLILLVERSIKPGDIIEVEGRMVKITKLGMRATVTRSWDSEDLIIPNSILVASTVKNFTLHDKLYRIRCPVGVVYSSDMELVRKILEDTARDIPWRIQDKDPVVHMTQFGSSSVDFDVSVWTEEPFMKAPYRSQLHEAIWFALKDAGVTIAFPQLDVHFDGSINDSVRQLAAKSSG